ERGRSARRSLYSPSLHSPSPLKEPLRGRVREGGASAPISHLLPTPTQPAPVKGAGEERKPSPAPRERVASASEPGEGGATTMPLIGRTSNLGHLKAATRLSHPPCGLRLKAARGVTIALVSARERKRRQPGLATDDPAFVGWHQLVGGIQG